MSIPTRTKWQVRVMLVIAVLFVAFVVFAFGQDDAVTIGGKSKFIQPTAIVFLNASGTPVLVSATNPLPIVTHTPTATPTPSSTFTPTPTPTP